MGRKKGAAKGGGFFGAVTNMFKPVAPAPNSSSSPNATTKKIADSSERRMAEYGLSKDPSSPYMTDDDWQRYTAAQNEVVASKARGTADWDAQRFYRDRVAARLGTYESPAEAAAYPPKPVRVFEKPGRLPPLNAKYYDMQRRKDTEPQPQPQPGAFAEAIMGQYNLEKDPSDPNMTPDDWARWTQAHSDASRHETQNGARKVLRTRVPRNQVTAPAAVPASNSYAQQLRAEYPGYFENDDNWNMKYSEEAISSLNRARDLARGNATVSRTVNSSIRNGRATTNGNSRATNGNSRATTW